MTSSPNMEEDLLALLDPIVVALLLPDLIAPGGKSEVAYGGGCCRGADAVEGVHVREDGEEVAEQNLPPA
jgi:hypothetical protein